MEKNLQEKIKSRKNSRARHFVVLLTIFGAVTLFTLYMCGFECRFCPNSLMIIDDVLGADKTPSMGHSIFFLKNGSGGSLPDQAFNFSKFWYMSDLLKFPGVELTPREACAVESAALHNAKMDVYVLLVKQSNWMNRTNGIMSALLSYRNVHFRIIDLQKNMWSTPLDKMFINPFKDRLIERNTLELLPYFILWRWGGTFLDFDALVLRNLNKLGKNYVVINEKTSQITTSVMNFSPYEVGHLFTRKYLEDYVLNLDKKDKDKHYPEEILSNITKRFFCSQYISEVVGQENFFGIKVYGTKHFGTVEYPEVTKGLNHSITGLKRNERKWFAIYSRNKLELDSKHGRITNGLRNYLAMKHCPKVYKSAIALGL